MALGTPVHHNTEGDTTNSGTPGSYTSTGSWTPTAGRLQVVGFATQVIGGVTSAPVPSHAGHGDSYTLIRTHPTTDNGQLHTYWCVPTGTPTSGQMTFTLNASDNSANGMWTVFEISGDFAGGGGSAFKNQDAEQDASSTTGDVVLAATPADLAVGIDMVIDDVTITVGSGFTEIGTATIAGGGADQRTISSEYDATPVDATVDFTTVAAETHTVWASEIIEVAATGAIAAFSHLMSWPHGILTVRAGGTF